MISQTNHSLRSNRGSALIVTILLISVMLAASLILLQRIIPYAKSVRSMNDAAQAYYTARGELESGRFGFLHKGGVSKDSVTPLPGGASNEEPRGYRGDRKSGDTAGLTIADAISGVTHAINIGDPLSLALPVLSIGNPNTFVVSSVDSSLPLKAKLFALDTTPVLFGTSRANPAFHTLTPWNSGGLRFDLRGVKTGDAAFGITINFPVSATINTKKLSVKMQYADIASTKTFTDIITLAEITRSYVLTGSTMPSTGNIQIIDTNGTITAETSKNFDYFLDTHADCANTNAVKTCDLILSIDGATSVDFQLTSLGSYIPDLNAIVIGDGLSDNGLYFQRVMELIPTIQDI